MYIIRFGRDNRNCRTRWGIMMYWMVAGMFNIWRIPDWELFSDELSVSPCRASVAFLNEIIPIDTYFYNFPLYSPPPGSPILKEYVVAYNQFW